MELKKIDIARERHGTGAQGAFCLGDVRALMPELIRQYAGKVQLIYIDPPFCTGQVFTMRVRVGEKEWKSGMGSLPQVAYEDTMPREAYLAFMREVLTGAHQLLADTGLLFLHIDYRMHAHLRLMMDELFGGNNFLNEIIWAYQTGGRARKFFSRKHDVILLYRKTRRYRLYLESVPIPRMGVRNNHMKRHVDADGRVYRSIRSGGKVYTYYDDEPTYPGDVWDDVSHLQQKDPQRTGYDTQKPAKLLERIVLSGSAPGDLVCDLFSGSGTCLEVAWRAGRRHLGVDASPYAMQVTRRRLTGAEAAYHAPPCAGEPRLEADIAPAIAYYDVTLRKYEVEPDACARAFSGLDAVDNWAVGYLRGDEFVEMARELRTRHHPALSAALQLPVLEGRPCIRVDDVLGRYFYYVFEEHQRGTINE